MNSGKKIRKEFIEYLGVYAKKQTSLQQNDNANGRDDEQDNVEVGFVNGLFELFKLRELIAKCKAEILSFGVIYNFI